MASRIEDHYKECRKEAEIILDLIKEELKMVDARAYKDFDKGISDSDVGLQKWHINEEIVMTRSKLKGLLLWMIKGDDKKKTSEFIETQIMEIKEEK